MFDMTDIIYMSKLADRYLIEYEALLESSEMQASNVNGNFRSLNFTGSSNIDYNSDDWASESVTETSETSGELSHSLGELPEYSVCAGSKPLSLIIRRCSTPTSAYSSPHRKIKTEISFSQHASNLTPVPRNINEKTDKSRHLNTEECRKFASNKGIQEESNNVLCKAEITDEEILPTDINTENVLSPIAETEVEKKCEVNEISGDLNRDCENFNKTLVKIENDSLVSCLESVNDAIAKVCELSEQSALASEECKVEPKSSFSYVENDKSLLDVIANGAQSNEVTNVDNLHQIFKTESPLKNELPVFKEAEIASVNKEHEESFKILTPQRAESIFVQRDIVPCKSEVSCADLAFSTSNCSDKSLQISECLLQDADCTELPYDCSSTVADLSKSSCSISLPLDADQLIDVNSVIYGSEVLGNSSYGAYSPLLFSSDEDESPSFKDEVNKRIEAALAPSPGHTVVLSLEKTKLTKIQELLIGAPPPPSLTNPQYTVTDMLQLIKENEHLMATSNGEMKVNIALAFSEAIAADWPKARNCQYPGIHYNHGVVSENYETQCQKLQERCVGNETASTCTLWSSFAINTAREKRPVRKQMSNASPGRRLSHLARRQRTFSSSNLFAERRLQNILPHCNPERRTILVNVKKKSAKKQNSSQKKKNGHIDRTRNVPAAKLNSSKRALFQSPNEEEKPKSSPRSSKFRASENRSDMRSRRALFVDAADSESAATSGRKRRREDSEDNTRKVARRMLFTDTDTSKSCDQQKVNDMGCHHPNNGNKVPEVVEKAGCSSDISSYHKKKLLWAVAEALKQKGLKTTHPSFRECAAALASRCRVHLHRLLAERQGSTSDRMLSLASEYVSEVIAHVVKD